jgi:hypothetical protein
MKAAFWRFAHQRYQNRKPLLLVDAAAFTWFALFALIYGAALLAGWLPDFIEVIVGLLLGSGLIDHSQKMTVAARAMAERKTVGQRS